MRNASEDLWLLSRWLDDQRAVAVGPLRQRLERFGIAQITVVGDACRSLTNSPDSISLVADHVLGRGPFNPRDIPDADIFNATTPFHEAYMVRGQKPEDDRCILSGVLEEALSGAREEAFDAQRGCITSDKRQLGAVSEAGGAPVAPKSTTKNYVRTSRPTFCHLTTSSGRGHAPVGYSAGPVSGWRIGVEGGREGGWNFRPLCSPLWPKKRSNSL
jgi:hypothetical protein